MKRGRDVWGAAARVSAAVERVVAALQGLPMHMGSGGAGNGAFGGVPMQGVPVHGANIDGLGGSGMFSALDGGNGSNLDLQQAASMLNGVCMALLPHCACCTSR